MDHVRKARHISRGGRAFLPQWRMRQIRWEEAEKRSQNKREKKPTENLTFVHWDCTCGSVGCLGNPRPSGR